MPDVSQFPPVLLLIAGLGAAWVIVRFVFKLALRAFIIGCAGILLIGLLLFLAASNFPVA